MIKLDDFLRSRREDHTGVYEYRSGWDERQQVEVPSAKPGEKFEVAVSGDVEDLLGWGTARIGASFRNERSLSSDSTTRKSLRPTRAGSSRSSAPPGRSAGCTSS